MNPPVTYRIGKVPVHAVTSSEAQERILRAIHEGRKTYVCISNMRTVVQADRDPAYLDVMEQSLMNVPDGMPLVWCGRAWGIKRVERVVGLDLFTALLQTDEPQFFLGDTDETLSAVTGKAAAGGTKVAGSCSPPFAPLEEYDLESLAGQINRSGATLVWTSLRAPKQDFLAARMLPYLHDGIVLIGVGAAFRLYLGEYVLDRGVLEKMGLGGLRMLRNTTLWKELKWYGTHTFHLLRFLSVIFWKRLCGKSVGR